MFVIKNTFLTYEPIKETDVFFIQIYKNHSRFFRDSRVKSEQKQIRQISKNQFVTEFYYQFYQKK